MMEAKIFKCNDCGREFELDYQLVMHESFHRTTEAYTCEICGQGFGLKEQLEMHRVNPHNKNDSSRGHAQESRKLY